MRPFPLSVSTSSFLTALLFAGASTFGQSAATDPVGFITVAVAPGSAASPTLSLASPTLVQPVLWQGPLVSISGTQITVAANSWTAGQFGTNGQYFVEISSGIGTGAWTDIESVTTNTLTTLDDLTAFAPGTPTIRIRKHTKLTDFLGVNNSAGLLAGTTVDASDEVMVYDGSSAIVYWYYNGTSLPQGWYDAGFISAANVVIAPHQGVVIKRKAGGALSFTATGNVKTGNTLFPIRVGLNVVGTVSAKGLTLSTSGLYTGLDTTGVRGGTAVTSADEVTIFTPTGPTVFWYYNGTALPVGWYDSGFNAAGTVAIPAGSSLVLNRKAPGGAFNWVLPSPATF